MELQDSQFEQIQTLVNHCVRMHELQVELLDHLCCHIERELDEGVSFEQAFKNAMEQLAPDGLPAVEVDTIFLLTYKTQITMKKLLYSSGFFASFFTLSAFAFRTMHWPGGSAFMFVGNVFLLLSMLFIAIIAFRNFSFLSGNARFRSLSGAVGGIFVAIGSMFKILHYPGANVLFLVGTLVLISIFLPVLFFQLYKNDVQHSSETV
jgi:hypothetical protein